jgi:hypothetical protein
MADMDNRVTSVLQMYQQRVYSEPFVPSSTFGRPKVGANGVANKLFVISSFRRVLYVVCFLLGNYPASGV